MKKFLLIILIFFLFNLIVATPVLEYSNKNPQPKETIIATISTSGKFLDDIKKDDIKFFEGQKQFFPEYEIYNFNNKYYLYIIFSREGTFRLETNEILYTLADEVSSKKINNTFNVKYNTYNNQTNEFSNLLSVKPGVIYTLSNSSKLNLINRGNNELNIKISDTSFKLAPFQAKTINLKLVEPLSFVNINTYKSFSVPVIFLGEIKNQTENVTSPNQIIESNLLFRPFDISLNLSSGETRIRNLELSNNGENKITNLTILNKSSLIEATIPSEIKSKETKNLSLKISANMTSFNQILIINYLENNISFNFSIPINVNLNKEIIGEDNKGLSCLEYGGTKCNDQEKCNGESNITKDGFCCYGECVPFDKNDLEPQKKNSSSALLIGLLIFFALAIIGYILFKKYKKVKPQKPDEKIEISKKRYENRLKGAVTRD